ncbi:MAG: sigma-70 family RNA polymerase sigma factor [Nannocystaceae bacterium]|nr:sigma-70 family RNA polymerase sigma factor [Nannocystaceae bacterium]
MRFFRNKIDEGSEDLVQRTFLACVEGKERFEGRSSFRTYLFAVAHNLLRSRFRQQHQGLKIDFTAQSVWDVAPAPSTVMARDRTQRMLLEAMRRIPIESQVALELHYWESLTAAEIGVVIDVPTGTAKTRIRRARQLLGQAIETLAAGEQLDTSGLDLDTWARSVRQELLR